MTNGENPTVTRLMRRGTVHFFAYGLDLEVAEENVPRDAATLRYHRLALVRRLATDEPVLTVVPDPEHTVPGVVLRLDAGDLSRVSAVSFTADVHQLQRVVVWLSGDRVLLAQAHRTCGPIVDAAPCPATTARLRGLCRRHGVSPWALDRALGDANRQEGLR